MTISIHKMYRYQGDVWDFKNIDTVNLNRELQQVNWSEFLLSGFDIDAIYDALEPTL